MNSPTQQELLRKLPSITDMLEHDVVLGWLAEQPRQLVTDSLRYAVTTLRRQILDDSAGRCGVMHTAPEYLLEMARQWLAERTTPHIRQAINATGIILHTGLGRAVWPESVVDSLVEALKGYATLAIDPASGQRLDRDKQLEYLLTELTGAEAATVVNNNAAATMLALAALTAEHEVIVSRGQLIEIGGSFRLPEVMAQSRAQLVEVGATNRTHLRDYQQAISERTAAFFRAHPSNYRIVGFTAEVPLAAMVELAHQHNLIVIDDLGAGALVDLEQYGLPHEPTVQESIAAGADLVLFSADKLIGASQGGIIVGKKALIARIRKHPLARALRVDKSCLMALERTLQLFRDPARLATTHPLYRMLATPLPVLHARAELAAEDMTSSLPAARVTVEQGVGYLGSGALPMQELPTWLVTLSIPGIKVAELSQRLRENAVSIVARIEDDRVLMDMRTVTDADVHMIADAVGRMGA
jgi:L-seryl-tRNA(Ser) seleniumtransferase